MKYWRFKYRFCDKEKTLALGVYPEVSLKDAREKRDQARALLSKNVDPLEQKHAAKMAIQELNQNSFEAIAREWCDLRREKSEKVVTIQVLPGSS